ncbi:uncharacterized protein EI90DRAFT_953861 [Cantharellus anzutake]|uniref:uncharacterized protein n=1 Tax=Cantharellus anzutake TaxID=1750568 RepID=UPI001905C208|nr:uncharacterized protein EI90DRAFT_953861 [Cantharellus anzutake]KAF8331632.1 hypothetical protein EI90DRAFT_953861 [Cantharellus anzutake]
MPLWELAPVDPVERPVSPKVPIMNRLRSSVLRRRIQSFGFRDEHAVRMLLFSKYGDVQVYLPDDFQGPIVYRMGSDVDPRTTFSPRIMKKLEIYDVRGSTYGWLGKHDGPGGRHDELYAFALSGRVYIQYHGETILPSKLLVWRVQQSFRLFARTAQLHLGSHRSPIFALFASLPLLYTTLWVFQTLAWLLSRILLWVERLSFVQLIFIFVFLLALGLSPNPTRQLH